MGVCAIDKRVVENARADDAANVVHDRTWFCFHVRRATVFALDVLGAEKDCTIDGDDDKTTIIKLLLAAMTAVVAVLAIFCFDISFGLDLGDMAMMGDSKQKKNNAIQLGGFADVDE